MMSRFQSSIGECEHIRSDLTLYSGGDLDDPAAVANVRSHLAGCAPCRTTLTCLIESLDVLQSCAAAATPVPGTSLWPALARRLPVRMPASAAAKFNVWVPTAAMTAACAAMILVTIVQFQRAVPFASEEFTTGPRSAAQRDMSRGRLNDQTLIAWPNRRIQRDADDRNPAGLPNARSWQHRTGGPDSTDGGW